MNSNRIVIKRLLKNILSYKLVERVFEMERKRKTYEWAQKPKARSHEPLQVQSIRPQPIRVGEDLFH